MAEVTVDTAVREAKECLAAMNRQDALGDWDGARTAALMAQAWLAMATFLEGRPVHRGPQGVAPRTYCPAPDGPCTCGPRADGRCDTYALTPWGRAQCALPIFHAEPHAFSPSEGS